MEVKRKYEICNDQSVIEYVVRLNKDEIDTEVDKYDLEYPTKEASDKVISFIKEKIPDDEEVLYCHNGYIHEDSAIFSVNTKRKSTLQKEEQMIKVLNENGIVIDGNYHITIYAKDESWVRLDPYMRYTRGNLEKIMNLIGAKDYEVIFDGHMEEMYLIYDL